MKSTVSHVTENRAKGNGIPDLTDGLWIHGDTDGEIFHVITDGTKGPTPMKGFKKRIDKENEVAACQLHKKSEKDRRIRIHNFFKVLT